LPGDAEMTDGRELRGHKHRSRHRSTLSKAGWRGIQPTSTPWPAASFNREDLVVEIRVEVPDARGVHGLVRRLADVFDRSSVWFDEAKHEVRVRSEWESRAVIGVVNAVESWLAEDGIASAKLSVGDRCYTMAGLRGRQM